MPEGAVELQVAVCILHRAGFAVGDAVGFLIRVAVVQAATDQVLLSAVERVPEGAVGVCIAADPDNLTTGDVGQRLIVKADAPSMTLSRTPLPE